MILSPNPYVLNLRICRCIRFADRRDSNSYRSLICGPTAYGFNEAEYAASATMSSSFNSATTLVIILLPTPARAPSLMS